MNNKGRGPSSGRPSAGGPSSAGRSAPDADFRSKLDAARARRMKVLAERGETMPAPGPATKATIRPTAIRPTTMHNLRKAIGQPPLDADNDPDPDPEPAGSDFLPLPSDIEFPEFELPATATHPVPFQPPAEMAPAPLPPAALTEPASHPGLSFSFVALLLAAAGIGLSIDRGEHSGA